MGETKARVTLMILIVLGASSAGCLTGQDDAASLPGDTEDGSGEDATVEPFEQAFTLQGCAETGVVHMIDFDHAASVLPDGFEPADADAFMGSPAPMGQAAAFITATTCEGSTLAEGAYGEAFVGITVETPDAPGEQGEAVDMYALGAGTSADALMTRLDTLGWSVYGSAVTNGVETVPIPQASGSVEDAEGDVYAFEIAGPHGTLAVENTYRWWHVADPGVSYVDYEIDIESYLGTPTCEIRSESPAAQAAGTTDCSSPDAMGIMVESFDVDGTWVFLG